MGILLSSKTPLYTIATAPAITGVSELPFIPPPVCGIMGVALTKPSTREMPVAFRSRIYPRSRDCPAAHADLHRPQRLRGGPAVVDLHGLAGADGHADRPRRERPGAVRRSDLPDSGPLAIGPGGLLLGDAGRQRRRSGEGPQDLRPAAADEPLKPWTRAGETPGQLAERAGDVRRGPAGLHAIGASGRDLRRADRPHGGGHGSEHSGLRQPRLDAGPVAGKDLSGPGPLRADPRPLAGPGRNAGCRHPGAGARRTARQRLGNGRQPLAGSPCGLAALHAAGPRPGMARFADLSVSARGGSPSPAA